MGTGSFLFRPHRKHILLSATVSGNGPGSSVGTATGYGLDGPGIKSLWGAKFSAPVQTGPGAHSLLNNGYRVFPGDKKRPGRDADPSPLSSAVIMKG